MDERWAQDVLRCHLCETPGPTMYCAICHIHMCKACEREHLSDISKKHKVLPFEKIVSSTMKCPKHFSDICIHYCEICSIPICTKCASQQHKRHRFVDMVKKIENQKHVLQKDLQELEKSIYPKYQEIASNINIPFQKADLNKNSKMLMTTINKHGEHLHREVDIMIQNLKSDIDEMDSKHLNVLNKQEEDITRTITEITQRITDLKKLLNSNDVSRLSAYKSRNAKFRRLPPKLRVSLPGFTPKNINREELYKQFGSLSELSIKIEEHCYAMNSSGCEVSPSDRQLIDVPRMITNKTIGCQLSRFDIEKPITRVAYLNDEEIWTSTCSREDIMRLYNLQGEILASIDTDFESMPSDIAVTRSGDLVYTDFLDGSVKDMYERTLIQLWDTPTNVCSTAFGDLLVVLVSEQDKKTQVVRFSGFKEVQSIEYDDKGQPLYSSSTAPKWIIENRNLDICVADCSASAVVVVCRAGKHRFTYTGPPSTTNKKFSPCGIAIDSQSRILTADNYNQRIHILDQDGQFLRYIDNRDLQHISDICVDSRDNLIVAESHPFKLKKIQYCK